MGWEQGEMLIKFQAICCFDKVRDHMQNKPNMCGEENRLCEQRDPGANVSLPCALGKLSAAVRLSFLIYQFHIMKRQRCSEEYIKVRRKV